MRVAAWAIALTLFVPVPAAAEWQVRPFLGFSFGASTTFFDPEVAIETQNVVWGVAGGWLGEVFGLEADFGKAPGFFQRGDSPEEVQLVSSAVTTLTGNVVIALPRRMAEYGLRPYFSGGAGLTHVDMMGKFGAVDVGRTLPTLSLGGGVTGFSDEPRRVELGYSPVQHVSRRRRDGRQQPGQRSAVVLAGQYGSGDSILMLMKRLLLTLALLMLTFTAAMHAQGTLRIVPLIRDDQVQVSVDLDNGYSDEVRDVIGGGVKTTFTYEVTLKMIVPAWVDRTIATAVVTTSDRYDTLTRVHSLSRTVDGRVVEALVTDNEATAKKWLTSLSGLVLCRTSRLDQHREYYVRISAGVRPPGATLLGWATGVTNLAKFTFVP